MIVRSKSVVVAGLAVICLSLIMIGMVSLQSASAFLLIRSTEANVYRLLGRQLMWFAVGLAAMSFAFQLDHSRLQKYSRYFLALTVVLLILCLKGPLAVNVKGASRWIAIGSFQFQPSDFAKLSIILYLADVWSRKADELDHFWRGVLPSILILGFVLGLILLQPDKGTAIFIAAVAGGMWFIAGAKFTHMIAAGGAFVVVAVTAIMNSEYAWRRVTSWLDPAANMSGGHYQVKMAVIGMERGGWTGVGLGESTQTLGFIPEVHTDFIFSVIAEELGFIASVFLVLAFAAVVTLALIVAWQSGDRFGALLAAGCGFAIDLQALLNLLVVTGSIPTTGISLPFISYGGSGLVIGMTMIGLVASVAQASLLPDARSKSTRPVRVKNRAPLRPRA